MMTRPWGYYEVIAEPDLGVIACVKQLVVYAGASLSLQRHALRHERWYPHTEGLVAFIDDERIELEVGRTYDIPIGVHHRLTNEGLVDGVVTEVMYGVYDEDDIERFDDMYGRT